MALLDVRNVRRSFGGLVAVDHVSFAVTEGHIKAVIGPNGAGKTTVFNMISGLLRTETGSVVFDGKNLTGLRPHQIAAAGIARTFQNPTLFLQMNVLENVMVGGHRLGRAGFTASVLRMPWQRREERSLRENARARLQAAAQALQQRCYNLNLSVWGRGLSRVATRLALLVCGDLLRAGRAVAEEDGPKALDDLLAFALSLDYLDLRRELGAA